VFGERSAGPLLALALLCAIAAVAAAQTPPPFDAWLADFLAEARSRGYSEELLAETLGGLTPLVRVIESDRRQPEVRLSFDEYLRRSVTPDVVRRGRELAAEHRELLARVHHVYGVPPRVILAIWGIETKFGQYSGDVPVVQALATLAWEGRRGPFFRAQLYDALTMVARRHIDAPSMKGSWAGAMGQPQFMPSSYLTYAVDFDGDGRRDIWTSHADTFASIANYLVGHGWYPDEPWGREVRVTSAVAERVARAVGTRDSGCAAMRNMSNAAPLVDWRRLGVRLADGRNLPAGALGAALVQAGRRHFLVHGNYEALLYYNCAHRYALAVAILADRIG
jgi:membrane-bound lytic murein transglycosylase B